MPGGGARNGERANEVALWDRRQLLLRVAAVQLPRPLPDQHFPDGANTMIGRCYKDVLMAFASLLTLLPRGDALRRPVPSNPRGTLPAGVWHLTVCRSALFHASFAFSPGSTS